MRKYWILALAIGATGVFHAPRAAAQQTQTITGSGRRAESGLGFSYGWNGGITQGPDGKVTMGGYPTVRQVAPNSPPARAGLQVGDVIVSVNGRDGRNPPLFSGIRPGEQIVLRIRRGDEERELSFVRSNPGQPAR